MKFVKKVLSNEGKGSCPRKVLKRVRAKGLHVFLSYPIGGKQLIVFKINPYWYVLLKISPVFFGSNPPTYCYYRRI